MASLDLSGSRLNRRTRHLLETLAKPSSLRKAAGYTQVEFAAEEGLTQRMVACHEAPGAHSPRRICCRR